MTRQYTFFSVLLLILQLVIRENYHPKERRHLFSAYTSYNIYAGLVSLFIFQQKVIQEEVDDDDDDDDEDDNYCVGDDGLLVFIK